MKPKQGSRAQAAACVSLPVALCVAALALGTSMARAQDAQTEEPVRASPLALEEVVVTGRAGGQGMRKLDTSYAITTLSDFDIEKLSPRSTADLFKTVPGVWTESSGGESGANVFVRGFPLTGDADFTTVQLDGMPIFPPPTLSFLENSTLFRIDETVQRFEALRGGSATVLSNGQPGVTLNFIQKQGGPEPEGRVKLSGSDYGMKRVDAIYSGPINDDTFYSIGGFWRVSEGVRDAEFKSERGGQLSANVTRFFDTGEINLYGRVLNDRNAWLLPIPVVPESGGGKGGKFGDFSRGTGTFIGNDIRLAELEVGRGSESGTVETVRRDLADGRGADIQMFGGTLLLELAGGWQLSERFLYMAGDADTRGAVPDGAFTPRSAAEFLGEVDTAGLGGEFTFTGTGEALTDLDTQLMRVDWWSVDKGIESFSNDLSANKEIFAGNTLTLGVYYADFSSDDLWFLFSGQLLTAEPNGKRIDLALNDGRQVTRNGFLSAPGFSLNAAYQGESIAGYVLDEWQINDSLRVDAGVRVERHEIDGSIENVDTVDLDDDPTTLHNNAASVLNGTFRTIELNETEASWTVGANFAINDEMAVFGRANGGKKFPTFDNLRDGDDLIKEVEQFEVGFKASTEQFGVFATLFYNEFEGLSFTRFIGGEVVQQIGDADALGVELEVLYRPIEGLDLQVTGTWQNGEFNEFGDNSGNDVPRQPEFQTRFSPAYDLTLPWGTITIYGTWTWVDDRFSDPENLQPLDSYSEIDVGALISIGEGVDVQVQVDNLTNSHALTEGDPRIIGLGGDAMLARPILGRSIVFSLGYRF
jgi:outer membrane cobalamin receptor